MPTKRRRLTNRRVGIPLEAIAAWRAGDYWGLHRALKLRLWQMPSWECDPPNEDEPQTPPGLPRAPDPVALKRALIEIAGPPPKRWIFRSGVY
jgi:hypothetical protein